MIQARRLMRKLQTLALVVFSFLITTVSLHAQTYPVQGNAFLIPPYSLRLSDYATSTTERLAMNVLLTDVTRAELRVRFRLHIEGPTISIDSKAEYIGNPVVLQGGVSLRLSNLDLSEYFNWQNLHFTGITEREFLQKGTLPEGLYKICFEVLEYNRGVKISQSICAQAFFVLNDPPIVNLPRQGEVLRAQMPQNVIMQWTPRHTGSPNSAFNTQYEIKVVEVWPADRNPNDAILTQPAIYETTTANTSLIYGPDATQLEPGRTYAFRVRVVPMGEADQLDLFKNNGYSETVSFVYGQACQPPASVTGKVKGPYNLKLDWTQDSNHTAYQVHFRKKGSHDWWRKPANINTIDLWDLEANTSYEYEVGAVCGDFESQYSAIGELQTMEAQKPLYECGAQPKRALNTNPVPLPEPLKVGDTVHTQTVDVLITKVIIGNGTFSGEAEARMKIFNNALMKLTYKDIRVNIDYWLLDGYFEAERLGVELPKGAQEGVDVLEDVLSESQGGGTSNDYKAPPPDTTTFVAQETITIPDGIQTITKDAATGIVTVTDTKGVKHDLPPGKDVAVADKNGRGALVDKQGQITNTTAEQAKAAGKREYSFTVVFEKPPGNKAGFDKYDEKTTALKNTYQKIEEYMVPWKAIGPGADGVKGNINFGTAKDLLFAQEGARLTYNEFTNILTVNPVPAGSTAQVIVKEKTGGKEKIRGQLNVAGYAPMSKTVHIIPVNNATCTVSEADLKQYLDEVYGQALVSWQADIKNKIEVSFTEDFDDGGSGLLSTYTGDMRKVIKAYGRMEQDHYYIFLLERGKTKTGYMPRGKRAGFVFLNSQNAEELKHTIAHELGHGAFTLRHPFAEYPSVTAKSTDNLMDYAGGTHLYKWQWDQIHNPVAVIGLFEGDEEGQLSNAETRFVCLTSEVQNKLASYSYVKAVNGQFLKTGNSGITPITLVYEDKSTHPAPIGSVVSFFYNNEKYTTYYNSKTSQFQYYAKVSDEQAKLPEGILLTSADGVPTITINRSNCTVIIDNTTYTLDESSCKCNDRNEDLYQQNYSYFTRQLAAADASTTEAVKNLCDKIARLKPDVIKSYNSWVETATNPNNYHFQLYRPSEGKLQKEDLQSLLEKIRDYEQNHNRFIKADFSSSADIVSFVNAHFTGKGSRFNTLISAPFTKLSLPNRKKLLNLLASDNKLQQRSQTTGDFQSLDLITHLLICSTSDDAWACLQSLENDNKLFHVLEQSHDFLYFLEGGFARLTDIITKLSIEKNPAANDKQKVNALIESGRYLIFDNSYTGNSNKEKYDTNKQRITFEVKNNILEEMTAVSSSGVGVFSNWLFYQKNHNYWEGTLEAKPLDNIIIIPVFNFTYRGTTFLQGVKSVVPAVAVYGMFKEDTKQAITVSTKLTANLALTFTGAAILGEALRAGATLTIIAQGADLTLGTGASIINSIPEVEQNHEDFVKIYNKITIIYGLARAGYSAYKSVKPFVSGQAGKWMDDIYNTQKNIVAQWKNKIASGSNIQKGNFGEMASDVFLSEKGFQPLHPRLQNINAPTKQGIDGVFKKGNEYFILEAKYKGTARLSPDNPTTDLPKQMSDDWIQGGDRLLDAVGGNRAVYDKILYSGYKRLLAEVGPDGLIIFKELDGKANIIGTFTP